MSITSHFRLSEWSLRRLFRESGLLEQATSGTMLRRIVSDRQRHYPVGSGAYVGWARSVMAYYFDDGGVRRAYTHQLLHLDGTPITEPDPKWVRVDLRLRGPGGHEDTVSH